MLQIIASDMDGTLLDDKLEIPAENVAAIKAAQARGVHFIVATGRGQTEVDPLLKAAGIKCPLISINGAAVYDEDRKLISAAAMPLTEATKLIRLFKEAGLYFEMVTSDGIYSDSQTKRIQNFAHLLVNITHTTFKEAVAAASARAELMNIKYTDDFYALAKTPGLEIFKLVAFDPAGPAEKLTPLREKISENKDLVVTASSSTNIEVNHVKAQKGLALAAYADYLNVPLDNVMAIGDNNNDVSMLKTAGISYAMANGSTEVKRLARYTAPKNTAGGVGKAIMTELNKQ